MNVTLFPVKFIYICERTLTNMNPGPFTYEHFTQALQSLKDGMLMYYIDEAVGIYCQLRGKSVGPRPTNVKDYTPEYADAFEAANFAVYTVATKIRSFDSRKGAFRPYLDRALENALKDIMKADGKGDFFNQTSRTKDTEDEPEKHERVDVDRYRGAVTQDSEPDSVISEREERVRKHKDDALETMIRFIDTLPEMKRAWQRPIIPLHSISANSQLKGRRQHWLKHVGWVLGLARWVKSRWDTFKFGNLLQISMTRPSRLFRN